MWSVVRTGLLLLVCAAAVQGLDNRKLLQTALPTDAAVQSAQTGNAAAQYSQAADPTAAASYQQMPATTDAAGNAAAQGGTTAANSGGILPVKQWQAALNTVKMGAEAAVNKAAAANAQPVTTDQAPKKFVVDLAPGSSVSLANQNGYPKIAAQAPGTGVIVAQGPGMSNPDVSFNLGPNDSPVKVTLGRQSGLSGGVANNQDSSLQASQESGLSGELNLGHYGVTQANSFEAVNINTQGAELITPFAKLAVPYKAFTQVGPTLQQIPAQLQQLTKVFQVQSASAPAPALATASAPMPGQPMP